MSVRRRVALGGVVVLLAGAAAAPAAGAKLFSAADAESFSELQSRLGGTSGVAISGLGKGQSVERLGSLRKGVAWSTSKVPVAMAVVAAGNAGAQRSNLRAAITASDNAAAERLWASLGSPKTAARRATAQLRAAGDRNTNVRSKRLRSGFTAFGQTTWTVADQARFIAGMSCVSSGRAVLDLMGQTVGSQRWGLGRVNASARLKGGWGPGSEPGVNGGYLDRQMGIIRVGGHPIAVAIATKPADGSHEAGIRNVTEIARWAASHADTDGVPTGPACN